MGGKLEQEVVRVRLCSLFNLVLLLYNILDASWNLWRRVKDLSSICCTKLFDLNVYLYAFCPNNFCINFCRIWQIQPHYFWVVFPCFAILNYMIKLIEFTTQSWRQLKKGSTEQLILVAIPLHQISPKPFVSIYKWSSIFICKINSCTYFVLKILK